MNLRLFRQVQWPFRAAPSPTAASAAGPATPLPEINTMSREQMIGACRNLAAKELDLARGSATNAVRSEHVFNAAGWAERADVLQRMDTSFRKREALDRAAEAAHAAR